MKESGLRENCMIRLNERTEEGTSRPPSTLHRGTQDNTTCGRKGALLCSCFLRRYESVNAKRLTTPKENVQQLQEKLGHAAKESKKRRFHALYDKVYRLDILWEAWRRVRADMGSAEIDGETPARLAEIRQVIMLSYRKTQGFGAPAENAYR
ncbi:Uncharacterised protein [Paenibacillus thiaminolyticus]|nr:Uncharacterised protein [Paenibacillus thiaminolyticus]